jgi:hypothetical protein
MPDCQFCVTSAAYEGTCLASLAHANTCWLLTMIGPRHMCKSIVFVILKSLVRVLVRRPCNFLCLYIWRSSLIIWQPSSVGLEIQDQRQTILLIYQHLVTDYLGTRQSNTETVQVRPCWYFYVRSGLVSKFLKPR